MDETYKINLGTFCDFLNEEWLEPLNLSQYKLVKDLGISASLLSKIFKCKNKMSDDLCRKLARHFGMSPNYFIRVQAEFSRRNREENISREMKNLQKEIESTTFRTSLKAWT